MTVKAFDFDAEVIPLELRQLDQWVGWRSIPSDDNETQSKVPFVAQERRKKASTNDPKSWRSFDTAIDVARRCFDKFSGIGFVFAADDPYVGIDIDDCLNPDTGELANWAKPILGLFKDTYAEISPSRTGIKLFAKRKLPIAGSGKKEVVRDADGKPIGAVEVYQHSRYFTVTSWRFGDYPSTIADCSDRIPAFWEMVFGGEVNTDIPTVAGVELADVESPPGAVERCRAYLAKLPPAISGEGGHDTTFHAACELFRFGLSIADSATMLGEYNERSVPSWSGPELQHKLADARKSVIANGQFGDRLREATSDEVETAQGRQQSRCAVLAKIAESVEAEYWHTSDRVPWVTVRDNGTRQHFPVGDKDYRHFLLSRYFATLNDVPNKQSIEDYLAAMAGQAVYVGPEYALYIRVARVGGTIFFDLADEKRQAIEITQCGWRVITNPPVRFARPNGMLPLPVPSGSGGLPKLKQLLRLRDEQWPLIAGWLLGKLNTQGTCPILLLCGEKRAAKTTMAKVLRDLIDPHTQASRRLPTGDDLAIAAMNNYIPTFYNVGKMSDHTCDDLCRIASGGGIGKRTKYSDLGETLLSTKRSMILNGIGAFALPDDLMDRLLRLRLSPIPNDERLREADFWERFRAIQAACVADLCTAASAALKNESRSEEPYTRLTDFAHWVGCAEPELGLSEGEFRTAMQDNTDAQHELTVEASELAMKLLEFARQKRCWTGNYAKLLAELNKLRLTGHTPAGWPQNPTALRTELDRLCASLSANCVTITQLPRNSKGVLLLIQFVGPVGDPRGELTDDIGPVAIPTEQEDNDPSLGKIQDQQKCAGRAGAGAGEHPVLGATE